MSVYPTSRGWSVDYRDEFNRRVRVHVGTEQAARAFEARIKSHVAAVRRAAIHSTNLPDLTITEAYDLYINTRAILPSTRRNNRALLSRFTRAMRHAKAREVTPLLLHHYTEQRRLECSPSTLRCELQAIKALFGYLAHHWYIHADPSTQLNPGAIHVTPTATLVTREQQHALLQSASAQGRLRILLALDAGLRASEILAVRANHIAGDPPTLTVWSTKNQTTRIIPLTQRIQNALERRWPLTPTPDTLLIHRAGRKLKYSTKWHRLLREKSGIHFRFHDLRHTFASRLAACGAPLHVIRALLGHRPANTTDLYVHASPEELRHWIDKMEDTEL